MNTPIMDWQLSIQLAGNNIDHANEFLQLLADDVSKQLIILRDHLKHHRKDDVKNILHKLLGGLSYSGALRLKNVTTAFYHAVKHNEDIDLLFLEFENEAEMFVEYIRNY